MKPSVIATVVLIAALITLLLWRERHLSAEVERLRAAVAAASSAARGAPAQELPSSSGQRGRQPIAETMSGGGRKVPRQRGGQPIAETTSADARKVQRQHGGEQNAETIDSDFATTQHARLEALETQQREVIDSLNWATEQLNRMGQLAEKATRRAWGEEQVIGEPDTATAGDLPTAWAPAGMDAGEEWLHLGYEQPVEIAQVRVRETLNPGAITRVSAVLANGSELTLWQGSENAGPAPYDAEFNVPPGIVAGNVKVYLDTRHAPGWEEIDAVELVGRDGTRQWAKSASASSTYASPSTKFGGETLNVFSIQSLDGQTVESGSLQLGRVMTSPAR